MNIVIKPATFAFALFLTACAPEPAPLVTVETVATLPTPHSNNAVAVVPGDSIAPGEGGAVFYSFNGLEPGKTYEDVTSRAFACAIPAATCKEIAGPPVAEGRLASTAVFLHDRIFLFGGYSVTEDGTEVSTPEVFAFNPATEDYQRRADMPAPVDDAVAFSYASRYIYLVSGWHDDGNVSLVQVFDTWEDKWFRATDYPGAPVFGHSGGAAGGKFVIADGVAVIGKDENGRRQFGGADEAWLGEIDESDPAVIHWKKLPSHGAAPLYRMAAIGEAEKNRILFYGGGDNPYNYDGIGYDGAPSKASDLLFAFDLESETWISVGRSGRGSMDHRGLMRWNGAYWTLGGMNENREVTGDLVRIRLSGD